MRDFKSAIFRLEQPGQRGTAFSIAPDLMLTAYHCLKCPITKKLLAPEAFSIYGRKSEGSRITYELRGVPTEFLALDEDEDWALIRVDFRSDLSLSFAASASPASFFETFGFPESESIDGLQLTGTVVATDSALNGIRKMQLRGEIVCIEPAGLSGAPVLVADVDSEFLVIGVITDSLSSSQSESLYACPAETIFAACNTAQVELPQPKTDSVQTNVTARAPLGQNVAPARRSVVKALPFTQNPVFTGRMDLLMEVSSILDAGESVVLTGLGGIGKSQIALEFAYKNSDIYQMVWWGLGTSQSEMDLQVSALAERLGAPSASTLQEKNAFLETELQDIGPCLIVLEDLVDPNLVPKAFVRPNIHLLITSRNPNWLRFGKPIPVGVFSTDESIDFLQKRTRSGSKEACKRLASLLGSLPLALEQASSYIESTGISVDSYSEMFWKHRLFILEQSGPVQDYHATVRTTWSLNLEQAHQRCNSAKILLDVLSFFSPDKIPKQVLRNPRLLEALPKTDFIEVEVLNAVAELRRFSLLQVTPDTLSVHGLVQEVCRSCLSTADQAARAEVCLLVIESMFPHETELPTNWPHCSLMTPHVLSIKEHLIHLRLHYLLVPVLNQLGCYFKWIGHYRNAEEALSTALDIVRAAKETGEETDDEKQHYLELFANILHNLAGVKEDLGDLEQARAHALAALEILPNKDKYMDKRATILNGLSKVYQMLGDTDEAKVCLLQALELNPNPITAGCLAVFMHHDGDWQQAKRLSMAALDELREIHGEMHLLVIQGEANLSAILLDLGEVDEALRLANKSLTNFTAVCGDQHPDLSGALSRVAHCLERIGNDSDAVAKYEEALHAEERHFGAGHIGTASLLGNLGNLYSQRNDERAQIYLERAKDIVQAKCPENIHLMALTRHNLGMHLLHKGDFAGAETQLRDSDRMICDILPLYHPDRTTGILNLAKALEGLDHQDECNQLYESLLRATNNPRCPEIVQLKVLQKAGSFLTRTGAWAKASAVYERAQDICKRSGFSGTAVSEMDQSYVMIQGKGIDPDAAWLKGVLISVPEST